MAPSCFKRQLPRPEHRLRGRIALVCRTGHRVVSYLEALQEGPVRICHHNVPGPSTGFRVCAIHEPSSSIRANSTPWRILNFVSRMWRPVVTVVESDGLDTFKTTDEIVFIGHISASDTAAQRAFAKVAEEYREEFTFGLVTETEEALIHTENVVSPTVICHVVQAGETKSFSSFSEPGTLDNFVVEASRPVIGELTPYNQQRLLKVSSASLRSG